MNQPHAYATANQLPAWLREEGGKQGVMTERGAAMPGLHVSGRENLMSLRSQLI